MKTKEEIVEDILGSILIGAILALVVIMATSCRPFAIAPYEVYRIEAGEHYPTKYKNKISPIYSERLEFVTWFNASHIYDNGSDDINKLYGITSPKIHENSARFGWRYWNDAIEIFAYYYIDGERHWHKLGDAKLKTRYEFSVDVTGYWYEFNFNGNKHRVYTGRNIAAFRSFPYFGGDNPAPHVMTFTIVEL